MNKLIQFFILAFLLLTLTACSDLFGKKVSEEKLTSGRLKADCELDMDRFADILEEPIAEEIGCLQKNLDIFMDVSELGRGDKLSRIGLENYLRRNKPETTEQTYKVIKSVFALARLITGDEKDFIARKNVDQIIDLLITFNYYAYNNYNNTFGSEAPANLALHESHRIRINKAASEVRAALQKIYVADRGGDIQTVDLMDLIQGFVKSEETIKKIEGVLFVKKIIFGGEIKTLNHLELGFLFDNLPRILGLILDGVRYEHLEIEQVEIVKLIKDDVVTLANLLFHPIRGDRRFEGMINVDMAVDGIDGFIELENDKIGKYRVLIKEAVKIFTKTKNEVADINDSSTEELWITGKDLEKIFDHIYAITDKSLAFHRFYNSPNLKPHLDAPISFKLDPKKYEAEFPEDKVQLADFARIINSYRYMKGSFDMAYYSLNYSRNPNGVAEIGMYEHAIKTFFGYYGSSLSIAEPQLRGILKKFENELIEMDIIMPRRSRNTAENIALLGSLFQSQSDDNKVLDVDEAAEFAVSLVTAIDAKKKVNEFYSAKKCLRDEFDRIDPACFREHFFEALCTSYRPHLPRLFEYLGANPALACDKQNFNSAHNIAYLSASSMAARTCSIYPDTQVEIFYSESDIMSIILAMMHIETTIIRWDQNQNNIMDKDDVLAAFTIYKPAIAGMLPAAITKFPQSIQDFATKVVFQYLVKFEDAPKLEGGREIMATIGNLVKMIGNKAPASRKTIASILKVVGDQGKIKAIKEYEADPTNPNIEKPFDCNWLHDPDNIPRD